MGSQENGLLDCLLSYDWASAAGGAAVQLVPALAQHLADMVPWRNVRRWISEWGRLYAWFGMQKPVALESSLAPGTFLQVTGRWAPLPLNCQSMMMQCRTICANFTWGAKGIQKSKEGNLVELHFHSLMACGPLLRVSFWSLFDLSLIFLSLMSCRIERVASDRAIIAFWTRVCAELWFITS